MQPEPSSEETIKMGILQPEIVEKVREQIKNKVARLSWGQKELHDFQIQRLKLIMAFARANSDFWRTRFDAYGIPENLELLTMTHYAKLPLLTKKEVMENWESISTFTGEASENNFRVFCTGGSSGRRGKFVWNEEMLVCSAASTYRWLYLEELRNTNHSREIAVVISATDNAATSKHGSTPLFSNVGAALSKEALTYLIPADLKVNEILHIVEALSPTHLVSYSSILEEIANAAINEQVNLPRLRWVMINSEPLSEQAKRMVFQAWGIEVTQSWGCTECLIGGMSCATSNGEIVLCEDDIMIELSGSEVERGIVDKFIVTPLQTTEPPLPLFRYIVDDKATVSSPLDIVPSCRIIKKLSGRNDPWFLYENSGRIKIHPILFRKILGQSPEILEYQVQQTKQGASIKVVPYAQKDPLEVSDHNPVLDPQVLSDIEKSLTKSLCRRGLINPQVTIETVSYIKRKDISSKAIRFIPC